jgi:hypothetical protein
VKEMKKFAAIDASGVDVFDFSFAPERFGRGLSRSQWEFTLRHCHKRTPSKICSRLSTALVALHAITKYDTTEQRTPASNE